MKMVLNPEIVATFHTGQGAEIYQLPVEVFPGMWGNVYLVLFEDYRVLIDTGSGLGKSNDTLEDAFQNANELIQRDSRWRSQPVQFTDLTHILITHGHIDHFGGLDYLAPLTSAQVGVHELDRRILTNYEERLLIIARRLEDYLIEAGVSEHGRKSLMEMYLATKTFFSSLRVDFTYEAQGMRLGPFEMLHVPGHSAGHVVIRLHDVLFAGDHVLEETSPHQSPERLSLSTGLDHYLHSLEKLRRWAGNVQLVLGGHKTPIQDLSARLDAIEQHHKERLQQVLTILRKPQTIKDVSHDLFGEVYGYNILLALEEAGAHVEYLYQRGLLEIENLEDLEHATGTIPLRYRCVECTL